MPNTEIDAKENFSIEEIDAYALPSRPNTLYLSEEEIKKRNLLPISMEELKKELNKFPFKIYLYTLNGLNEVQIKDISFNENIQLFYYQIGGNLILYPMKKIYGVKYVMAGKEKMEDYYYYFEKVEELNRYLESLKMAYANNEEDIKTL